MTGSTVRIIVSEIFDQAQIMNDSLCAMMKSFVFGLTSDGSDQTSCFFLLALYLAEDIALEIVTLALSERVC